MIVAIDSMIVSIHIARVSFGSHRIHAIDSIHIVQVSSHPRSRLDPHRPGLIPSTLSTRSTSSRSNPIHAIDSIHIVRVSSHPRYRLDPHVVHVSSQGLGFWVLGLGFWV